MSSHGHLLLLRKNLNKPYPPHRYQTSQYQSTKFRHSKDYKNGNHSKTRYKGRLTENGLQVNGMIDPTFVPSKSTVKLLELQIDEESRLVESNNADLQKSSPNRSEHLQTISENNSNIHRKHVSTRSPIKKTLQGEIEANQTNENLNTVMVTNEGNELHEECDCSPHSSLGYFDSSESLHFQKEIVAAWLQLLDARESNFSTTSDTKNNFYSKNSITTTTALQRAVALHKTTCIVAGTSRFVIATEFQRK